MSTAPVDEAAIHRFFANIRGRHLETVERMLAEGMPATIQNAEYHSALTVAATVGFVDGCKALIDAGAKVNQRDHTLFVPSQGLPVRAFTTALIRAIQSKNLDTIKYLLSVGADPRIADENGNTPAHFMFTNGLVSDTMPESLRDNALAILHKILSHDDVVSRVNNKGEGLLHTALADKINVSHPDALKMLLDRGVDINAVVNGSRAYHCYWDELDIPFLRMLVSYGADINARDWRGATPLFFARDEVAVEAILELGCDLNAVDNLGRNALGSFCADEDKRSVLTEVGLRLVAAGIDYAHKDYTGISAESSLETYIRPDNERILATIKANKAKDVLKNAARTAAATARP